MGHAIGQCLPFAIGVAISPLPIIAVVLMLATPHGRFTGSMFLVGWVAGLILLGTAVLLISSSAGSSSAGGPATWVSILKLVLGALLLLVSVKQWRRSPQQGAETQFPKWMATIDRTTGPEAVALGALLADVNPKNLLITVGAAAAIAQTGISGGEQAVALGVFVVIASLGVGAPVAILFLLGDRASKLLAELKDWMAVHNAAIMAILLVVIGFKLIGDGISGLSS
jgi:threonine/homoserine/homoserine lactone efflux protein